MLFKLCGVALITAVCSYIIKKWTSGGTALFVSLSFIIMLYSAISRLYPSIAILKKLADDNLSSGYFTLMLKALGISLIVKAVSEVCEQMGESVLSTAVETVGKGEIFILCIPCLVDTVESITELLS